MPKFLAWCHGLVILWGSDQLAPGSSKAPKPCPDPITVTVGWGFPPPPAPAPQAPIPIAATPNPPPPEDWRYLVDRLTAIADTACNYREYHTMQIPDHIKINALHDGLDKTARRIRELIIELSGNDPWEHHPPGAAP